MLKPICWEKLYIPDSSPLEKRDGRISVIEQDEKKHNRPERKIT